MSPLLSFPYSFEPLGDHDRAGFDCGVPELDRYLQTQARQDAKRKVAAPFVMVDQEHRIIGYYTLSAYAVRANELPAEIAERLPKYPVIPATLLGRLAIDRGYRGQKLGAMLLMDALYRSWKNTSQVASVGVVAEAYSDEGQTFYLHHEFISLLDHPRRLFISMQMIQKVFAQTL